MTFFCRTLFLLISLCINAALQVHDFLWSNLLDSIQCFGKVGILQARYLHKNPGICQRECRFITTAHVSQHIVLHHGKLSIGSQLVLKAVYFMINLTDKRLHKFVGGFGTDRQHSLPRIGHDAAEIPYVYPLSSRILDIRRLPK